MARRGNLGLSGMKGRHYGIYMNVKLNLAIFCVDQCGKCAIFCCVDKNKYTN